MGRLTHRTSPGGTYFVTTKAWQNISVFQVHENAEIHEFVLMPNHLHLLLTPSETVSLEKAIQLIKGGSSYEIPMVRADRLQIWQSGFHESRVRDWVDYKAKADYIRFNPVATKLVQQPQDWRLCSANGHFVLDPIPQGLKPKALAVNVGPEGPTPKTLDQTPGLKPRPPKEFGKRGGV